MRFFLIQMQFSFVVWSVVNCVRLVAYISQHGLHGEFHFVQQNDNSFEIRSKLQTTLQYPDQTWSWGIHEYPIDYREIKPGRRCHPMNVGKKLIDFDSHLGYLQLPGNESTNWEISSEVSSKYTPNFPFLSALKKKHQPKLTHISISFHFKRKQVFGANQLYYRIRTVVRIFVQRLQRLKRISTIWPKQDFMHRLPVRYSFAGWLPKILRIAKIW